MTQPANHLYSTVKNLMGVAHPFGYLPPHGKTLPADASYSVPGNIVERILGNRPGNYDRRRFNSLQRDLIAGRIAIESTPPPIFFDAAAPAAIANPTVAATNSNSAGSVLWTGTTGVYKSAYTWLSANGETSIGASRSSNVTLTNGVSKLQVTTPALPSGATGVNVYLTGVAGGAAGTEIFLFTSALGGALDGPADFAAGTAMPGSNTAALPAPARQPAVNVTGGGSSGGLLQAGAYFAKYTWTNANGETTVSPESTVFTVVAGNIPALQLDPAPPGVTGVNIYLTAAAGGTGTETLYDTVPVPASGSISSVLAGYLQTPAATNPEVPLSLYLLSHAQATGAAMPGANTALIDDPTFTPLVVTDASGVPGIAPPISNLVPYLAPGMQGDVTLGAPQRNGRLAAGVYYLTYSYNTALGETEVSPESVAFTVTDGQIPLVQLVPPARTAEGLSLFPAGVTSVNIYLTAAGGATGTEVLYRSDVTRGLVYLNLPSGNAGWPTSNTTYGHTIQTLGVSGGVLGAIDPSWASYEGQP